MAKRPGSYHHGNLREALLKESVAIIDRDGPEALTLRRAARAAGVSHTAPSHHFGDLKGLLAAIAEEGCRALRSYMLSDAEDPLDRMKHVGSGYIGYAMEHRGHFRAMAHPQLGDKRDYPSLQEAERQTFQVVVDAVRACQAAGVIRMGDPRYIALLARSTVHGFATLAAEGQLAHNGFEEDPRELGERVTREMFFGLRPLE